MPLEDPFPLIPHPRVLEYRENRFSFAEPFCLYCSGDAEMNAAVLSEALSKLLDRKIECRADADAPSRRINLETDPTLAEESYTLEVGSDTIRVVGGPGGLAPAVSTLRWLFLHAVAQGKTDISCLLIEDQPEFPWRGFHLDCSRHFMGKSTILRYLDYMALFKLNRFHWHLTDDQGWRIEIESYPRLVEVGAWRGQSHERYGGYYKKEEIREIVAYAEARGITIVPEVDIPGHATAIVAAYPELGCTPDKQLEVETGWGIFYNNLNAGNEAVYTFLEAVLSEIVDLFPSPWIHIGADECQKEPWKNCADCQRKIKEEGLADEFELQSYFIDRVLRILKAKNRTGIGWDEVLEGGLPDNIIVQAWQKHSAATEAARQNHYTIISPKDYCYFDYAVSQIDLEQVYRLETVPGDLEKELKPYFLGAECLVWTEYISEQCLDYMAFPRLIAFAEKIWGQAAADPSGYKGFRKRLEATYPLLRTLGIQAGPETSGQQDGRGILGRIDST